MARKAHRPPEYKKHASGQGFAYDRGRYVYFGVYDRPESREKYEEFRREWYDRRSPHHGQLVMHLLERYAVEHGIVKGAAIKDAQRGAIKIAIGHALAFRELAVCPIASITPALYEAFLDRLAEMTVPTGEGAVRPRYTRGTCNRWGRIIKEIIRWSERKGHAPVGTWHRLSAAQNLKYGRSAAREPSPVGPVSDALLEDTLPLLPPVVADMARFNRLVGCRPGEVCKLRMIDTEETTVDTDGGTRQVLLWTLEDHKTAYRGKRRAIAIGPQAILIVNRNAGMDLSAPVFRSPSGSAYRRDSYALAIRRACKRGGLEHWSPNQLRHARATELNRLVGIQTASAVLGHTRLNTTEVYAQRDAEAALAAAARTG